jgi:hypothetical protein
MWAEQSAERALELVALASTSRLLACDLAMLAGPPKITDAYGTFGMQRLIFSAKYRLLVRGGCSRPKICSGIRIRAQKQAESSG